MTALRSLLLASFAALTLALLSPAARGQAAAPAGSATQPLVFGGVSISPDGVLSARAAMPAKPSKHADPKLAYVSLPRAFDALKVHVANHTQPPADLLNLGNLTQIQYVFVYPGQHDLVIAGPTGPLDPKAQAPADRPTLKLDDLIVALRVTREAAGIYGCSLDLAPGSLAAVTDAVRNLSNGPAATLVAEVKRVVGPQIVRVVGVPDNSRIALSMLAADYRLKRMAMGVEAPPAPGVGSGLGSGAAANRLWFTAQYDPLLVSEDSLSYELRGPRLSVDAGAQLFEARGASESALRFAKNFSDKMPAIAARVDAIADLQNVTDLLVVAALINRDHLDEKAAVDLSWPLDPAAYASATYPTPKTADTIVNNLPDSLVTGGVYIAPSSLIKSRQPDTKNTLPPLRHRPETDWLLPRAPEPPAK